MQKPWGRSVLGVCEEWPGVRAGVVGEEAREVGLYMSHGAFQAW